MSTTYATNGPAETVMVGDPTITTPRHLTFHDSMDQALNEDTSIASPQPSPRINFPPPPNPAFVFPARPSSSAPSSLSRSSDRRTQSVIEIPNRGNDDGLGFSSRPRRSPALPDFTFNPGATLNPATASRPARSPALPDFSFNPGAGLAADASLLSPPQSPQSPRAVPVRNGHRRGGSEFVGGNLKSGESITVMSTSPTKSDSGFASPSPSPVIATHPRRGKHQHRRSGAISSHDLSLILQPKSPNPSRGSSAPTSPTDFDDKPHTFPEKDVDEEEEHSNVGTGLEIETQEKVKEVSDQSPSRRSPKPATRARVGFSDTLEFIPRPLSLVSVDTTSTATARPGHSVSGSISSIISLNYSTAADRDPPYPIGSPTSSNKPLSRPSTAGAILERTPSLNVLAEVSSSPRRRNSISLLSDTPQADVPAPPIPSPGKSPKRWSFFGLEPFSNLGSPTKTGPASPNLSDTACKAVESTVSSEQDQNCVGQTSETNAEFRVLPGKKKRKKKVKSWAGSILTRKPKARSHKSKPRRRSQTPPLHRMPRQEDDEDDDPMDMDELPASPNIPIETTADIPELEKTKPPRNSDDVSYPMIDLDAALGPFNTPSTRDPQWEEAQRAGAPPKRQLHSATGMRGFTGPGMHYHRRAESAPEMPPFEAGRFGIHRFGSSSTMADVFEEEEEEADDQDSASQSGDSTQEALEDEQGEAPNSEDAASTSTPPQDRDMAASDHQESREAMQSLSAVKRKGSGSNLEMQPLGPRMRTESSSNSLQDDVILEEGTACNSPGSETYRFAGSDLGVPSTHFLPKTPSDNAYAPVSVTPAVLPLPTVTPISPYSVNHSSTIPSPRSPMSYDAQRISTAPSSVTDENNFQSLMMGEPGPEVVRLSFEVPSLTDSNSTMTRESTLASGIRPRNRPFQDQRPASFSSTAFGRRRSSLASLSRLISSAHGERSKLSMEVPCDPEPDKKPKRSKSKRLGRMMQFWKSKESTES